MSGEIGKQLFELMERLYPICRSITGNGVRRTLDILSEYIPLRVHEVPSGTPVFDWEVPREWNISEAWIKDPEGRTILDFRNHNLHVMNYSIPVHRKLGLAELKEHLFSLPAHPDWIPYRTSYHNEAWGFCMPHRQLESLCDGEYEVFIDATLEPGSLTYAELLVPGRNEEEILLTTHICHPSLCNDNLSGIVIATFLAAAMQNMNSRYSYRFLFAPGTIGSITWLSLNPEVRERIRIGLVVSLLGEDTPFHYKQTRAGNDEIDRIVKRVLSAAAVDHTVLDFSPYGYDERQFCSPGVNLSMGRLTRRPNSAYPEYHTSADNLDLVRPEALAESLNLLKAVVVEIESAERYINLKPMCEPRLGVRGLFASVGGGNQGKDIQLALLWILNLSDGSHSFQDIVEQSGMDPQLLRSAVDALLKTDLLKKEE